MSEQKVYLDDIYASEKCEGSTFKAVVMMAQEARFINDQARQGFIELEKKPTTIAMYKFQENRLEMTEEEAPAPAEEYVAAENQAAPVEEEAESEEEIVTDTSEFDGVSDSAE